jgi:hypothetical protein
MSSKQFLILIGTGIFCAVLFAAPGLYQLSKEYEKDKSLEWQRISKNGSWYEITRREEYQSMSGKSKLELKKNFFDQRILPKLQSDPEFAGNQKVLNFAFQDFLRTPDDTGQGYITSMLGSAARGLVAIIPWCFDELATWRISPGFTEFAGSVRVTVEGVLPVNPVHVEKWPMQLAFWLGFSSAPAAFFVIRARREKALTTAPPAPSHQASAGVSQD